MIHRKRTTAGVFLNASDSYFTDILYRTMREEAGKLNWDLFFFTSVAYGENKEEYAWQEREMFRFAPMEELDGIFLVPDSYEVTHNRSYLERQIARRAHCPVVTLRSAEGPGDCIFMDEKNALKPLMTHLIDEHKLTKLAYITGYREHLATRQREECFRAEMAAHGLEVREDWFFQGNMWYSTGAPAYEYFFQGREERPEAVICANDFMAAGLIEELLHHGIRVPEDVIVTGFDNSSAAENAAVPLTTIEQDYAQMAKTAIEQMTARMGAPSAGKTRRIGVPGRLMLGESCGCNPRDQQRMSELLRRRELQISDMNIRENDMTYLSLELAGCDSLQDLHDVFVRKRQDIPGQKDYFLCLFEAEDGERGDGNAYAEQVSDHARVAIAIRNREDLGMPMVSFDRKELLPAALQGETPQAWLVTLLYLNESIYGYSVLQYEQNQGLNVYYQHRDILVSGALRNMHVHHELQSLYEERRISSITDPLTGLYNRRGMEEQLLPRWESMCREQANVTFVYFDMDRMKVINDQFGHDVGDQALRMIAQAMREASPAGMVYARMGGDEFLAVLPYKTKKAARELTERFEEILRKKNEEWPYPSKVSYSFGAYQVRLKEGMTLDQCIRGSDKVMYEAKHHKQEERSV